MSVDRRLANLGVFLLILGAVPLAVSQGWLARETVSHALELWPLLLIGAGIGLILRRTPLHFAGGLLVAATGGTMLGALLAGGLSLGALGCGNVGTATGPAVLDEHGTFAGGATSVVLRATCAGLSITPASGSAWGVTVTGRADARPALQAAADRLDVRSPDRPNIGPFDAGQDATWNVTLGTDVTYGLDVNLNAGDVNLDLGGLRLDALTLQGNAVGNSHLLLHDATVGSLDVQVNAGDLKIALPATADLTGRVQANAASVALCLDPGTGLRLRNASVITGDNFGSAGMVQSGTTWESPGIGSAAHVVDLVLNGAAASFTLNPSEGCR